MKRHDSGASRFTFPAVMILLAALIVYSGCGRDGKVSPDEGYYTCSMHPQVIQHEPGNCPLCGMTLTFVPAKKDVSVDHSHEGKTAGKDAKEDGKGGEEHFRFSLAQDLLRNARINTVKVKKENFRYRETYSGHIDYNEDPDRLVVVNTKYDGWIERLYVSKEGQRVGRGAPLMAVYSQKILTAKEEYVTTYQSLVNLYNSQGKSAEELKKDATLLAARRKLLYLDVPASHIDVLEKTGTAERLTHYYAPISGIIVKKNVLQGDFIKPGQELFRIANLESLWVFIHIFEKDLPFIKKGQKVTITTVSYPGKTFSGVIDLIYPYFDLQTHDAKVRIIVSNSGALLKPGMYAGVEVSQSLSGPVLKIPDNAIIYSGSDNYVFVSLGGGHFEVRDVIVGARSGGEAVIQKGLTESDLVVSNGQFLLDSEASLKEALQRGGAAAEHRHEN